MAGEDAVTHAEHARRLATRVADSGETERELRLGVMSRGAGGAAIAEPYDTLAIGIGEDSSRVTDAQVTAVLQATGSQKRAFELVLSAAIGAGLRRWDAAQQAIEGAADASS
jgi:hypothetical protein